MREIIEYIDNYLIKNGLTELNAIEANLILEKSGLLHNSKKRPGSPLRKLLRKGVIPHAYQNGVNWQIPHSKKANAQIIYGTKKKQAISTNSSHLESFVSSNDFKLVSDINLIIPKKPGIYCIRITNPNKLSKEFETHLKNRNHDILYIGMATKNLHKRLLYQELQGKGHGTFFRSIGTILNNKPEKGSLHNKANNYNYKFSTENQNKIKTWLSENILINWIELDSDIKQIESKLIAIYKPLLNIRNNPLPLKELSILRRECIKIANS